MPFVVRDFEAADEAYGVCGPRGPLKQARPLGQRLDDARVGRFLKDDQIGLDRANHFRQRLFAPVPAETYVVAQELDRQSSDSSSASISV
jgi:hypothetical protein